VNERPESESVPVKVLHVIPALAACYGGPSKVVLDTCRALRSEGVQAEIATTNANGDTNSPLPLESPSLLNTVPVHFFERQQPWRYKFSWPMTQWLKQNVANYDLLHIHAVFSYSTTAAAFYARKFGVPYIIYPHGMLAPWPLRKSRIRKALYLKALEQKNIERANAIQFTAEEEFSMSIAAGKSRFVLPCIFDLEENHKERSNGTSGHTKTNILFLSRIDPKKGIDTLICALQRLASEGREFVFTLAGSGDAAYEEKVSGMIRDAGLLGRTVIKGFVTGEEKASTFRQADIFVLPSHQENFGIVVMEAMASGLPVIISNEVNIHGDIAKAKAGLVVSPEPEELYSAILELLEKPQLRTEMGERARSFIELNHSPASTAREMTRVYRDVIQGSYESSAWRMSPKRV